MILKDIYKKYQVPPNLQQHMMRVAGIARVIDDSWLAHTLDQYTLLQACLIHDIGNLLKFDLINKANFLGEEEKNIEHWKKVKTEMTKKYGSDEHEATSAICKEINLPDKVMWIVENWGFGNFEKVLKSDNWEYKICVYSDHRIGPFGVVSLAERFAEQRKRYQLQAHNSVDLTAHLSNKSEILAECAFEVEKQIQKMTKKDLASITDIEIEDNFNNFLKTKFNG